MLSLRDSGKIQQDGASVTSLAAECGLPKPFSLKDFIEKECLIPITHFRICVVPIIPWRQFFPWHPEYTPRLFIGVRHDKAWYENFFLNWRNPFGVAQFWHRESWGRIRIEGDVLDWTVDYTDPAEVQNSATDATISRSKSGELARKIAAQKGIAVENYNAFVVVYRLPSSVQVDGGTTGDRRTSVFRTEDPFDFHAHEVGHLVLAYSGVGGAHSYGYETDPEYCTGLYGHPYCIMSAKRYGGRYRGIKSPSSLSNEERGRGPGLNGATRYYLKWADGRNLDLQSETTEELELQSLGSNRSNRVLEIRRGERTYAIEYRSQTDANDAGISHDALIVNAMDGGLAWAREGHGCATLLSEIALITEVNSQSGPTQVANLDSFWGVQVVAWKPNAKSVRFRIVKNNLVSVRMYARTHPDLSFAANPARPSACPLVNGLKSWNINGERLKSLRALINT